MMETKIYVTSPSVGDLSEYLPLFQEIWDSGIFTHNGPLMQKLESELKDFLGVHNLCCVSSGTSALQIALRALGINGEVITTPFSFIATSNIIEWERCTPVFVDIREDSWNIDERLIEDASTDRTSCIMPVHVFSAPCAVDKIASIADNLGVKVIYDAAHAFGVDRGGKSITGYGDISCLSFHATKIFNTAEGGACVSNDEATAEKLKQLRFFGFNERKDIVGFGLNAKMTEVHAAIGLVNLRNVIDTFCIRRRKYELYRSLLAGCDIRFQSYDPSSYNYSYMPVLFRSEENLLNAVAALNKHGIYPRRYFHPSLNTLEIYKPFKKCPISEQISRTILCLPHYDKLNEEKINLICKLIGDAI